MTTAIVLHKRCVNPDCQYDGLQPVTNFYIRSGVDEPTNPGHYLSECKDCLKRRNKSPNHLPPDVPRAATEILAIEYLKRNHIPALPGKAYKQADVDILAWGCVRIEVKYSSIRYYNHYFVFNMTPRQRKRGLLADVVLFVCDYEERQTFHLFDPDDEVFYFKDGRRKSSLTFTPGQTEQFKHTQNRVKLTQPIMDIAQDRLELIETARLDIASNL